MADGPVIIKRIKKGGHGHHRGAWKVAYADFVTAMMAFFLLLWLLNAVTEEQLHGIADYFAPTAMSKSSSGAGGVLGGQTIGEGAMQSQTSSPSVNLALPPPTIGPGGEDLSQKQQDTDQNSDNKGKADKGKTDVEGMDEQQFKKAMAEREQQQFDKAKQMLEQAIKGIPELKTFANSLMVDNTPEGLRIQLVDQEGLAMFPRGSSQMYGHTRALLELVSRVVRQLPQKISISGHTDGANFVDPSGYTNWELSADRALSIRRMLTMAGVPDDRIARVVGQADRDLLDKANPLSPRNRRLSIVLLRDNPAAGAAPAAGASPPAAPGQAAAY